MGRGRNRRIYPFIDELSKIPKREMENDLDIVNETMWMSYNESKRHTSICMRSEKSQMRNREKRIL